MEKGVTSQGHGHPPEDGKGKEMSSFLELPESSIN
jgi:hypothetical protein